MGLTVPPDDTKDARLKDPHVLAVLTYASPDRVIRAIFTSDDPHQAALLPSFADATRTVTLVEKESVSPGSKPAEPARSIRIAISQSYPSPPGTVTMTIPISGDGLDLGHAQLPSRLHAAVWKR